MDIPAGSYKAAVFDLDGTLLRDDKSVSPRSVAAVQRALKAGWSIAIATGRHPKSALHFFKELGALSERSLAVCFNGSALLNVSDYAKAGAPDTGFALLKADPASGDEISRVACLAHRFGLRVHGYSLRHGLCCEDTNVYTMREIIHSHVSCSEGFDFEHAPNDERFFKVIAVGRSFEIDEFRAALTSYIKEHFEVMRTDDNFLEFIPHHCSKGAALLWMCEACGLKPSEIVAFGDAENDLLMIKNAGLGIAMGNAQPEVKAQADLVTLSNEQDGIAEVLESILGGAK